MRFSIIKAQQQIMFLNIYQKNKKNFSFTLSFSNRDDAGFLGPRIEERFNLKFYEKNKLTYYFDWPLDQKPIFNELVRIAKKRMDLYRDAVTYFPDNSDEV